jgi:hypothetical protein
MRIYYHYIHGDWIDIPCMKHVKLGLHCWTIEEKTMQLGEGAVEKLRQKNINGGWHN